MSSNLVLMLMSRSGEPFCILEMKRISAGFRMVYGWLSLLLIAMSADVCSLVTRLFDKFGLA